MKYIKYLIFSLSFFLLFDFKEVETDNYVSLSYNEESFYNESDYVIKLNKANIKDVINILNENNINILMIEPYQNKYNIKSITINNEKDIIDKYIKQLPFEESLYIKENGYLVNKIHIRCKNIDLIKLEKELDIKVLA